jgi:DNA polymerase I
MANDSIFIIDTFSLMFQVFHAIPPMTGTQGQPTNAVFGFTRDIFAILDRKPTHLLCAFDSPGPGHRSQLYDAYKANRAEMPEDLRPQIPLLKELLSGFGIPAIEFPEWEADDVIATVAAQAAAGGMDVVIVSSDKDIRQLLSPQVRLYNCRKNEFLDEAGLMADWGVRPDQVVDYQSLVGDTADNVPGVPKIGPKTAKSLIAEFGTLDHILANADKVGGKMLQKNLREFADQARMSRELVRLRTDLPLNLNLEDARVGEPHRAQLFELFTRLGFRRYASLMRPTSAEASSAASVSQAPVDQSLIQQLYDEDSLAPVLQQLSVVPELLLDITTTGVALRDLKIIAVALMDAKGHCWMIANLPAGKAAVGSAVQGSSELVSQALKWLAEYTGELVIVQAKTLIHSLRNCGLSLRATLFDLSVADYLLDAGARAHDLSDIADRYAGGSRLPDPAAKPRQARQRTMFDEEVTEDDVADPMAPVQQRLQTMSAVTPEIRTALVTADLMELYLKLERPLIHVLAELEHCGIAVNSDELREQSVKAGIRIEQLTAEVFAAAGYEFNVDSPKQLSDILYQKLGLPVLKKTKTGASTDQEVLEQLALIHPLPAKIIERRQLTKLKGTYLDTLPLLVHPETQRIHATFHQTVAATGRLSSSDPNLQNIPVRTAEGRQIRRAFLPGVSDYSLVCADYSQIELRILAHFSGDEALTHAFREGIDIHAAVAADVFQVPVSEVTSAQRRVAKAVNFGVIYGQSPFGLAAALNIDRAEATQFIDSYFRKYQGAAQFFEKVLEETVRTGYATTILNRRRAISGIRSTTGTQRNMSERTAINTVIQGSAADLIKKAMIEVSQQLADSGLRAAMLLQIHDELVFEVHGEDCQRLIELIVPGMQNAMSLTVPLVVDVSTGPNWLDQTDYCFVKP